MPGGLSLKEADNRLADAVKSFAPIVKTGLDLRLQTAEDLPRLTSLTDAEAAVATYLVQSALQEAPWRTQGCESRQVAWLQEHLPVITEAMHSCVSNQLDVSNRRISILQSLLKGKQQPHAAQDVARLDSERKAYMLLEILSLVVLLILPIAAMCDELSTSRRTRDAKGMHLNRPRDGLQHVSNLYSRLAVGLKHPQMRLTRCGTPAVEALRLPRQSDMAAAARETLYEGVRESMLAAQQHRVQHGHKLISSVWSSLEECCSLRLDLHTRVKWARQALLELGAPVLNGPTTLVGSIFKAQGFVAAAGAVWVRLVCHLPHACVDPALFSMHFLHQIIECQSVAYHADQHLHSVVMMLKAVECSQMCSSAKSVLPKDMQVMLDYFQAKARPEAQQQQLHEPVLVALGSGLDTEQGEGEGGGQGKGQGQGQPAVDSMPQVTGTCFTQQQGQPAACSDSTSGENHKGGQVKVEPAAADSTVASGKDINLDDMNALLQLMYGSSI